MARKPTDTAHLNLRYPEALRRRLERAAKNSGRSMNTEIVERLEQSFRREDFEKLQDALNLGWLKIMDVVRDVTRQLPPSTRITPGNKGAANTRNDGDRFGVVNDGTRNKRSVWEVTTAPFSEAHFATFPPALIEPCIKAGCPKDGTVLDPFAGAGTTGLVADRLQRNAILIELNPAYAAMSERRIIDDAPLFAEVST